MGGSTASFRFVFYLTIDIIALITVIFNTKIKIVVSFSLIDNCRVVILDIMLKRIIELIGTRHGANKELADAIGIHPTRITDWKTGPLHPNRER